MSKASRAEHYTVRRTLLWVMAVCGVSSALMAALFAGDTGEIRYRGGVLRFPVSRGSVRIASEDRRVSYVMVGHPDLAGIFARRGRDFGWGPGDQFGGGIVIPSTSNENLQMIATIEPRTRFLTQFDIQLREAPGISRTGADEKRASPPPVDGLPSSDGAGEPSGAPAH